MHIIKKKLDIQDFIEKFEFIASYDDVGQKHYLVIEDRERGGKSTLMKYSDSQWSLHGKGLNYCDHDEQSLVGNDFVDFIWKNRSLFNRKIKEAVLR
ncbi:hypothetical protein AWH48_01070 [Domibacillus aminovorans]|uniref:Uncharacterized protein n=1 Tax=Domibacillus aminovorans TaxID=29332 RepID=A0A177KW70_9BACI|nr:hypothetical protein [Domibacillus aminovorans]OAH57639.1 hypothetical protein AWH48_01070 [Domibacillus aminovorans]